MRGHDGHERSVAAVSDRNAGIGADHIQGVLLKLRSAMVRYLSEGSIPT
jgi:hypothetical protein